MEYAVQISGGNKNDCLMIGDSIYDAMAAKQVGVDCLAVAYGFGNVENMSKIGTILCVQKPVDLIDVFKKQ